VLYSRGSCGGGRGVFSTGSASELQAGELWLFLEVSGAPQLAPIERSLSVSVVPMALGDACDAPVPLDVEVDDGGVETAHAAGDLASAGSRLQSSCIGPDVRDVFYLLRLAQPRDLVARLTTSTPAAMPKLELRTSCDFTPLTACATAALPGAGAQLSATALPAGDYLLRIGNAGVWNLHVTLTPN
jgi:hypothetical protein